MNIYEDYRSNGNPNPSLDFFFHVVPETRSELLVDWLILAWKYDSLTALKLICNLRGVRGTGKSDKEGFYAAALWLHENHPQTLACNLKSFAQFGYFKDLPEILYRLLEGLEVRKVVKQERLNRLMRKKSRIPRRCGQINNLRPQINYGLPGFNNGLPGFNNGRLEKSKVPREERILAETKRVELEKEKARNLRKEKTAAKARKALERYEGDPDYQFLHDKISELFAEHLVSDLQFLNSGELGKISFAAKWCPSLDSSYDKSTLLCESIARRVFPRDSYPDYKEIEDAHYAYRIRDRLRKQFLVPLRNALKLPEVYIGSNMWESLPYNRVPSVAMGKYQKMFLKHDGERFKKYLNYKKKFVKQNGEGLNKNLESVKQRKAKVAAGPLLPHEIIASLKEREAINVGELQWKRMLDDFSKKGKLRDCLAILVTSREFMNRGTQADVCVALGLLVSDMSEDPWKGKVITMGVEPELHMIEGRNLRTRAKFLKEKMMNSTWSTEILKVFDIILEVAVNGNVKEDQMIKRLIVFSSKDKTYYQKNNNWEKDYQAIKRKFREKGYKQSVPEVVFWNLGNSSTETTTMSDEKGVALVSGFSKNLLSLFLEGGDNNDMKPISVMERAIAGEEYNELVVID